MNSHSNCGSDFNSYISYISKKNWSMQRAITSEYTNYRPNFMYQRIQYPDPILVANTQSENKFVQDNKIGNPYVPTNSNSLPNDRLSLNNNDINKVNSTNDKNINNDDYNNMNSDNINNNANNIKSENIIINIDNNLKPENDINNNVNNDINDIKQEDKNPNIKIINLI